MTAPEHALVVTGVSSLIGHHLASFFVGHGHRVIGTISKPPVAYEGVQRRRLDAVETVGVTLATLELTDGDAIRTFIDRHRPRYWIHHAGWATRYASLDYDLDRGHAVNVAPLDDLYPALRSVGCRGVIVTGSSAEYSDSDQANLESDCCVPALPYGLSKLTETLRARQLALQHCIPTRVARIYIPFGRYDAPNKLLPSVIEALRQGRPIDLSACEQHRDFLYMGDLVEGYAALLRDLDRATVFDVFNLCSGQAMPLRDLLLELTRLLDGDPALLLFGARPMRSGEPPVSYGSSVKAAAVLGWRPGSLREGLRKFLQASADTVSH